MEKYVCFSRRNLEMDKVRNALLSLLLSWKATLNNLLGLIYLQLVHCTEFRIILGFLFFPSKGQEHFIQKEISVIRDLNRSRTSKDVENGILTTLRIFPSLPHSLREISITALNYHCSRLIGKNYFHLWQQILLV